MRKMVLFALVLSVMTVSAFTVRNETKAQPTGNVDLVMNAAFRDGLCLEKLAGQNGNTYHLATAPWARTNDRTSFAAGYEQGYRANVGLGAAK
jgi:formate/nitrite transporter FocA (FNT family)